MRFVDLFAGLGGFHRALTQLGHECVFASEIDEELRSCYRTNFPDSAARTHGDIRETRDEVPAHDILCAGFPCQPFSKSGDQLGLRDAVRGTLFAEIRRVVEDRRPKLVLLENVGNFARHDGGRTWKVVRESLESLGYDVRGTEPKVSGGHGLISPHHFGHPHHRQRFFVVATSWHLPEDPFPSPTSESSTALEDLVLSADELSAGEVSETTLSARETDCIEHWNSFLSEVPADAPLPSFPIWADEMAAEYPFEDRPPLGPRPEGRDTRQGQWQADDLPPYARSTKDFPDWKKRFIRQNRAWLSSLNGRVHGEWAEALWEFPHSMRKLEWNCKGEERDLWTCVLQFRPSGLRAKRYTSIPALVAMTTTQIPILGPERRRITRREALRLLGFPDHLVLPEGHGNAFRALGNSVHVTVVREIVQAALATMPKG